MEGRRFKICTLGAATPARCEVESNADMANIAIVED